MFGVRLFPQILSDLNFFNVKSEKELASRLRAVQRVAAAAIGVYLMVRYVPSLTAKFGSSWTANEVATVSFYVGYWCLSFPTMNLILSGIVGYQNAMFAVSHSRNKEVGWTVINMVTVAAAYFLPQVYKDSFFELGPNLLEKLFQKVEDKVTQPLWDRFYKQ